LILDVATTGARAGVRPAAEDIKTIGTGAEAMQIQNQAQDANPAQIEIGNSMVIFEVRTGERMAMPLVLVERIESVPLEEIEFAGGKAVLQYRGEVMPLEDEGELLRQLGIVWGDDRSKGRIPAPGQWIKEAAATNSATDTTVNSAAAATILICVRPGTNGVRRLGIVVRRVLDITAGKLLGEDVAGFSGQLAMVRDRVTTVHRDFAAGLSAQAAILQEVA
jgi:two-component system, chemotaxis family, sensor kinase CheA